MTLRAVGGILVGYLIVLGLLGALQDKLLLFPPAAAGMAETSDVGVRLAGDDAAPLGWVREPDAAPAKATMLVFHGNAGCAHHHGALADLLARRGWRVVSVEYPGYCGRPGAATVDAILQDAARQVDWAQRRYPGRLAIGGYSLGAAVAAAVADEPGVEALLLITPWASLRDLAQHHYPYLPARLVVRRDLETIDSLERAARRALPIAVLAAGRDAVIPVEHARRIAQRHPHAHYLELPAAGHNDWIDHARGADWDALDAALGVAAASPR